MNPVLICPLCKTVLHVSGLQQSYVCQTCPLVVPISHLNPIPVAQRQKRLNAEVKRLVKEVKEELHADG